MPNHDSAKKRMRQNEKRRERNRHVKTRVKTQVRVVRDGLETDVDAAAAALPNAVSEIARAASKGVMTRRTAQRKISRLAKAVNRAKADGAAES